MGTMSFMSDLLLIFAVSGVCRDFAAQAGMYANEKGKGDTVPIVVYFAEAVPREAQSSCKSSHNQGRNTSLVTHWTMVRACTLSRESLREYLNAFVVQKS